MNNMMEYTITITKIEENPNYEEKEKMLRYTNYMEQPLQERFIEKFKTTATLNEEQWKKVQKAIIEALN